MASQRRGSASPSSGDHYDSETPGASCWSLSTTERGRQLWASCRRRITSERRSSRLKTAGRVRPRLEARLVCSALSAQGLAPHFCELRAPHIASTSLCYAFASTSLKTTSVPCISGLAQSSAWHATTSTLCYSRSVRSFAFACTLDLDPG